MEYRILPHGGEEISAAVPSVWPGAGGCRPFRHIPARENTIAKRTVRSWPGVSFCLTGQNCGTIMKPSNRLREAAFYTIGS